MRYLGFMNIIAGSQRQISFKVFWKAVDFHFPNIREVEMALYGMCPILWISHIFIVVELVLIEIYIVWIKIKKDTTDTQ